MRKAKKGSHNKGTGSQQLHDLMLRYAQDGQISNVSNCLVKGADVDYADGSLVLIAVWIGSARLLKLVLAHRPKLGLQAAISLAEKADDDKLLGMLNDYLKQEGLEI